MRFISAFVLLFATTALCDEIKKRDVSELLYNTQSYDDQNGYNYPNPNVVTNIPRDVETTTIAIQTRPLYRDPKPTIVTIQEPTVQRESAPTSQSLPLAENPPSFNLQVLDHSNCNDDQDTVIISRPLQNTIVNPKPIYGVPVARPIYRDPIPVVQTRPIYRDPTPVVIQTRPIYREPTPQVFVQSRPIYREPTPVVQTRPIYREPVQVIQQQQPQTVYGPPIQTRPIYREPVPLPQQPRPIYGVPVQTRPIYREPVQNTVIQTRPIYRQPQTSKPVDILNIGALTSEVSQKLFWPLLNKFGGSYPGVTNYPGTNTIGSTGGSYPVYPNNNANPFANKFNIFSMLFPGLNTNYQRVQTAPAPNQVTYQVQARPVIDQGVNNIGEPVFVATSSYETTGDGYSYPNPNEQQIPLELPDGLQFRRSN